MTAVKGNDFRNRVLLDQTLAIVLRKEGCQRSDPGDFWMYENGYLLFQGLLSSNSVCWWNTGLNSATKSLHYHGYVSPGALLVGSEPCAIDILKNAWARRILQPPAGYAIVGVEEIESCVGQPIIQTQWTPLPEAVCAVILRLSRQGRPAGIETIREALILTFPHVSSPSEQSLYDTLAQLTSDRKLYHTSNGYFIVTPERRRSRSCSRGRSKRIEDDHLDSVVNRSMLMSAEEALVMVHGDMATIRDGEVTHQMIQTNLADVICGGNTSDKILYPRTEKYRRSSFSRSLDHRGSFRLWRSTRRLRRSASTRTIARQYIDTPSGNEGTTLPPPKKESLLSRLFKKAKKPASQQIESCTSKFPPSEWFNSKAVHLNSIGTQTSIAENQNTPPTSYIENCVIKASRSATLPRRRLCHNFSGTHSYPISRDNSPLSRRNISYGTLPRNGNNKPKCRDTSRTSSRYNLKETSKSVNQSDDISLSKPSHKLEVSLDNSGPSSLESHKSSTKTESSFNSGPSSLESHKTVINTKGSLQKIVKDENITNRVPSSSVSNSFTLQVTTQGSKLNNKPNTSTTTTINGEGRSSTKIFVQNSPVRSVITFENGHHPQESNSNLVIINDTEANREFEQNKTKNTNHSKELPLNNSRDRIPSSDLEQNNAMNNNRKLSLQLPNKDGLSFHNLIKNVSSSSRNQFLSNSNPDSPTDLPLKGGIYSTPPSPTKSTDAISAMSSIGNIYLKNEMGSMLSFDANGKTLEKNILGSEPNISYKDNRDQQFPSLNDVSFNFTSLAAQKILKGVGLNSVDTLVELNMTNVDNKQKNCDVVHTDFGMF